MRVLTAAERLGLLRDGFEGVQASWSEGGGGGGSGGFEGPGETRGTTTLIDLVKTRLLTFWEILVRVTTSLFLKGMFWRDPPEARRAAFLDLELLRPCVTTMDHGGGEICGELGRGESWWGEKGRTNVAVIIRDNGDDREAACQSMRTPRRNTTDLGR